jgi:hypothetical protein
LVRELLAKRGHAAALGVIAAREAGTWSRLEPKGLSTNGWPISVGHDERARPVTNSIRLFPSKP